ncbi:MAG: F0F1 ATP synthase subunit epsilon [Gemmataceae bacterium]
MRLKVLLPSHVLLSEETQKVLAEGENGSFCLLPRHVDFVSALVPGILTFLDSDGVEHFVALDEGILAKCGFEVLVSTRNAIRGGDLGTLQQMVEEHFRQTDEREKKTRSATARLEAGLVRRFMDLKQHGPGF